LCRVLPENRTLSLEEGWPAQHDGPDGIAQPAVIEWLPQSGIKSVSRRICRQGNDREMTRPRVITEALKQLVAIKAWHVNVGND
jgi:hypothetical protein